MPEKVNKRKAQVEKDKEYEKKAPTHFSVQVVSPLRLDADSVSYHHIWRKYPDVADQK